jgi:hypothetical protein
MTVSSELNRKEYAGDGSTTAFDTSPVVFFDSADLKVYVVTTATGAATLQTITTHYTVSGGSGSTGTVTMLTAPTAAQTLVIVRDVAATQASDFVNNDINDAEVLEDALDRLTMLAQQNEAAISRSLRLADSDVTGADPELPTPAASKLIGWDSAGTALTNYASASIVDTIVPTAFMETVLDDQDGDAVIETLIDNMTAETAPAVGDLIPISDITANDGRKMTLENMLSVVNVLTETIVVDGEADYMPIYDASASAIRRTLVQRLTAFKVGSFTRDVSLAGSTQAVTGVGFKPKAVLMITNINGTAAMCVGVCTITGQGVVFDDSVNAAATYGISTSNVVYLSTAAGVAANAPITSMDSDGFTITWAKTGSPTGTATVIYLALR